MSNYATKYNTEGRLQALENDIKEIYQMLSDKHRLEEKFTGFKAKTTKGQLLEAYKAIVYIAKKENITLPKI